MIEVACAVNDGKDGSAKGCARSREVACCARRRRVRACHDMPNFYKLDPVRSRIDILKDRMHARAVVRVTYAARDREP